MGGVPAIRRNLHRRLRPTTLDAVTAAWQHGRLLILLLSVGRARDLASVGYRPSRAENRVLHIWIDDRADVVKISRQPGQN